MSATTLLPCPFCAGGNVLLSRPHEGKPEHWCAICTPEEDLEGCGASSPWCGSKEEAATKWNTRIFNEMQVRALCNNQNFVDTHCAMLKVGIEKKKDPIQIVMRNILANCIFTALGIEIHR
jgi:hypothetical protein